MVERPEIPCRKTLLILRLPMLRVLMQTEFSVDWDAGYSRKDRQPVSESTSRRPDACVLANSVLSLE